jgi:hypothetical protein
MVYLWEVVILGGSEQAKTGSRVFGIYAIFIHLSPYLTYVFKFPVLFLKLFFFFFFKKKILF